MNSILKFALPAGLGLAACFAHFAAFASKAPKAPKTQVVAAADKIAAGTVISESMLKAVAVTDGDAFTQAAVPFDERGVILVGRKLKRNLAAGELILMDDLNAVATETPTIVDVKPGEVAVHISLDGIRCPPGVMKPNAKIGFVVSPSTEMSVFAAMKDLPTPKQESKPPRILGPFRLLSFGAPATTPPNYNAGPAVGVAVQVAPDGTMQGPAAELFRILRPTSPGRGDSISAVVLFPE